MYPINALALASICAAAQAQCPPISFAPRVAHAGHARPTSIALADLNRDSRPDVVMTQNDQNKVSVYLARPDGTFENSTTIPGGGMPISVTTGDLNADGLPDIAVANQSGNSVSIYLTQAGGTITHAGTFTVGTSPASVAIGELSGDAVPDLAVANRDSGTVSILRGAGDGAFTSLAELTAGSGTSAVALADINHDGRLDVVATSAGDGTMLVFFSNGATFAPPQTSSAGGTPSSLTLVDLNADNLLDAVVTNYVPGTVSVLIAGPQPGSFAPPAPYPVGVYPIASAVADLDGNGTLDLAVANSHSDNISILRGTGNGMFQEKVDAAPCPAPAAVLVCDVNGDARPDLLTADNDGASLSLHLNTHGGPAVVQQPIRQAAFHSASAQFTVTASSSTPITYRWRMDGAPLTDGGPFAGTHTATLTITGVHENLAGAAFDVEVFDLCGRSRSNPAGLVVGGSACVPDLGMQGGLRGADGHLDNNDFIVFIDLFFRGCP